jgi:hypothetical protein
MMEGAQVCSHGMKSATQMIMMHSQETLLGKQNYQSCLSRTTYLHATTTTTTGLKKPF